MSKKQKSFLKSQSDALTVIQKEEGNLDVGPGLYPHQTDQASVISEEESLTHDEDEIKIPGRLSIKQPRVRVASFQDNLPTNTYTLSNSSDQIDSATYKSNGSQEIKSNEEICDPDT